MDHVNPAKVALWQLTMRVVWVANNRKGSGGDQVVSDLALYSVDFSSNPAEVYSFNSVNCLKRTKINKESRGWPIINNRYITNHNRYFFFQVVISTKILTFEVSPDILSLVTFGVVLSEVLRMASSQSSTAKSKNELSKIETPCSFELESTTPHI